jgi:hypothetical protein
VLALVNQELGSIADVVSADSVESARRALVTDRIDLAVLDDDAKAGLILEIKWFNEPSEIREVIEKTEEIRKGIKQLGSLKERIEAGDPTVLARLRRSGPALLSSITAAPVTSTRMISSRRPRPTCAASFSRSPQRFPACLCASICRAWPG